MHTCSSHNFIDPSLVDKSGGSFIATIPHMVAAANGTMRPVDKMCKLSWLLQGVELLAEIFVVAIGKLWSSGRGEWLTHSW